MHMKEYWISRFKSQGPTMVEGTPSEYETRTKQKVALLSGLIKMHFTKKSLLLDYGCCNGRLAHPLSELVQKVYGVDIVPDAIAMAKAVDNKKADFFLLEEGPLPFRTGFFSGAYAITTLAHVPHDEIGQVAQEIKRVVRKNGIMILYENVSYWIEKPKSHMFFRSVKKYAELFGPCEVIEGVDKPRPDDLMKEEHVVMIFRNLK
ncbi:MAG: class I SAM-dependent methyltransferase [Thermodesulfobacteriota bacterium]